MHHFLGKEITSRGQSKDGRNDIRHKTAYPPLSNLTRKQKCILFLPARHRAGLPLQCTRPSQETSLYPALHSTPDLSALHSLLILYLLQYHSTTSSSRRLLPPPCTTPPSSFQSPHHKTHADSKTYTGITALTQPTTPLPPFPNHSIRAHPHYRTSIFSAHGFDRNSNVAINITRRSPSKKVLSIGLSCTLQSP